MSARTRRAGVGGVAAVTMVTAILAGSTSSAASGVPEKDSGDRVVRADRGELADLMALLDTDALDALVVAGRAVEGKPAVKKALAGLDQDDLAALRRLDRLAAADREDTADGGNTAIAHRADTAADRAARSGDSGLRILRALQQGKEIRVGGVRLRPGSGQLEFADTARRTGRVDVADRGGELIRLGGERHRLTRELRVTDDRGGERVYRIARRAADADNDSTYRSVLVRYGRFAPANAFLRPEAVTYDRAKVPSGASIAVTREVEDDDTTVRLRVSGLLPNRTYGAHVHTGQCGARPADSAPHYQHRKAPAKSVADPRYANPRNEVWLDFTTDAEGNGEAVSEQDWTFRPGEARSVVLHDERTGTAQGSAGEAGARLACFTVPFNGR